MTDEPDDAAPVCILIDGSHVDRLRSKLNRLLDLEYITEHFAQSGRTVSAVYYRDTRDEAEQFRQSRLFDWLDRHRIERQGRDDFSQAWYVRERYGSNLVALGADAMRAACEGAELVFVAGDAKLIPVFEQLARMDVPVTLISTRNVPDSIAPPPPLVVLAETFIDVTEDDRFLLPEREAD